MRRMSVLLVVAMALVGGLAGCGDDDDGTTIGEGDEAVQIGGDVPDDFPDDVPLPEGVAFNAGSADTGYSFEVPATITNDDVVALYEDALPGFEIDSNLEVEPGESLNDRYGVTIAWDDGEINFISGDPGVLSVRLTP